MPKKKNNYIKHVKDQYEDLPYPPRNPKDEKKRLRITSLDHLPTVNHFCKNGRWNYTKNSRFLVAGGGTGDASIYLGEQLKNTNCEIIQVDLSKASLKIARERAKIRGLKNIQFINGSLLDIPEMNIGRFDYINCCGVLHHLENPSAGLQALKKVLTPNGCIGVMVYAQYGRTAIYQIQELMRIINKNTANRQAKIFNLKATLASLHPHHWLKFAQHVRPTADDNGKFADSGLYDLYLHEQDRAYTVPQIYDWAEENNFYIPAVPGALGQQGLYLPESYIKNPELLATIKKLPQRDQFAIGELMYGQIIKHTFYLTQQPNTEASLNDVELIPTWADKSSFASRNTLATGKASIVPFTKHEATYTIKSTPENIALFEQIDGNNSLEKIYSDTIKNLKNRKININLQELQHKTDNLLLTLFKIGALQLRAHEVPAQFSNI